MKQDGTGAAGTMDLRGMKQDGTGAAGTTDLRGMKRDRAGTAGETDSGPEERALESARAEWDAEQAFVERAGGAYEMLGQIRASGFFRKTATVATLLLIKQMKESKLYKELRFFVEENGVKNSRRVATFDQFCELCLGASRRKVDEDLQNLAALGEEFYAATQQMGLTYGQLRSLRALPEGELAEAARLAGEKDAEALKDLLLRQMDEAAHAKKELEKREEMLRDKDALYEKAVKKQQEAEIRLERFSRLPPDERALHKDAAGREALRELHGLGLQLMALWAAYHAKARAVFDAEDMGPETPDMLAGLTSALCAKMADDLQETGIRVDFRRVFYPDSLADDADYAALRGDGEGAAEDAPDDYAEYGRRIVAALPEASETGGAADADEGGEL